ncbi:Peptidoglycan/LPS O-acetylase OafA/YrhL, contains acyltransferase and SGNH-hydrolase domains [Andreprevotia lacus DSM 23236]|jgi:peptidoglycan/LPS O-acetylase OafA/YrhL|uniref:Peptidoglycan/LPS O-acetylase OafA/YrhL, contains acyltransferase and SGNH-hydrolase domains n=1 Tax=Andreprevotia lacus DSM 23236 TaxID=1121001 RepID=A0A1W1XC32_9NEIS|nr:acyltransferase family protein [Andreprevotia lacus]SMC21410.1 Peptidoglycan/LPS O-acetylase OafA/YrhL, contains acyltransferase and SGNH-hydrolase domains [Andreprevotia lacus DSM 23236]
MMNSTEYIAPGNDGGTDIHARNRNAAGQRGSPATSASTAAPALGDGHAAAHPAYRPDIDGLRAVAVLAVVIFHAFPRWLAGGYVGVDIFFVISGFLISSILFGSLRNNSFSFVDFYSRRARRIFPALIVMLVTVALSGWYVLTPDEFAMLGKHIAAGSGFVANVALWLETGYFDTAADAKPLLHLWSLGVEEQFYIVWPLLLWAAWRRRLNLLVVGAVIATTSFAANVYGIAQYADAVFYLPFTRFWELLGGAGLAYAVTVRGHADIGRAFAGQRSAMAARHACSLTGAALLAHTIYTLDKSHAFPGWWAVPPVLGAMLLIAAGPQAVVNRFVLGNRVMAGIGLISYPLYIWHWPLLAFGRILAGNMSKELRFALIGAAFVLAWATYRLVEQRLRRPNPQASRERNRAALTGLYAGMAALCLAGLAMFGGLLGARSTTRDVDALLAAQYDWDFPPRNFKKLAATGPSFYTRAGTDPHYVVFIGDSIVEQYAARVDRLLTENPRPQYSVIFATGPGCPAVPGVFHIATHTHAACPGVAAGSYELAHRDDVKVVVIGGNWDNYLNPQNAELMFKSGGRQIPFGEPGAVDAAFAALEKEVASLAQTKQVYLLLNSPKDERFSPKSMLNGSRWTTLSRRHDTPMVDISAFQQKNAAIWARLRDIATRHGARVIDPIATLCRGSICPAMSNDGEPHFMDHEHMRPFYVRDNATYIDQTLAVDSASLQ